MVKSHTSAKEIGFPCSGSADETSHQLPIFWKKHVGEYKTFKYSVTSLSSFFRWRVHQNWWRRWSRLVQRSTQGRTSRPLSCKLCRGHPVNTHHHKLINVKKEWRISKWRCDRQSERSDWLSSLFSQLVKTGLMWEKDREDKYFEGPLQISMFWKPLIDPHRNSDGK